MKSTEEKVITRNKAIKAIHAGADPELFKIHKNQHVRRIAWMAGGANVPEDEKERAALAENLSPHNKARLLASWVSPAPTVPVEA